MNARRWAAVGLGASTLLTSCGFVGWEPAAFREERRIEIPHVAGTALRVRTVNGGVTVDVSPSSPSATVVADVFATTAERLRSAKVVAERDAKGALSVGIEWPQGRKPSEGCSFHVTVPDATGVDVETSNGAVEVDGDTIAGAARVATSNGRVRVRTRSDAVVARSSNGAVRVLGVHRTVDAETSNGEIEAVVLAGPVRLRTSNGGVRLEIGEAFQGAIDVETSNGSIDTPGLDGKPGVRVDRPSRREARIVVGTGGEPSVVRSSNGHVVVTAAGR